MYGIIYKAVCPMGKVYVGQTTKRLCNRKAGHAYQVRKKDRRSAFQIALLELGVNNFTWEQIDIAETQIELDQKEKLWVAHYKADDPAHGYNSTDGGASCTLTIEHRQKISMAITGEKHHFFGKCHSAETLNKMSKAQRGERNAAAKLTEADARQIKIKLAEGEVGRVLAKKYGVTDEIISKIKRGKTWRHIQV